MLVCVSRFGDFSINAAHRAVMFMYCTVGGDVVLRGLVPRSRTMWCTCRLCWCGYRVNMLCSSPIRWNTCYRSLGSGASYCGHSS